MGRSMAFRYFRNLIGLAGILLCPAFNPALADPVVDTEVRPIQEGAYRSAWGPGTLDLVASTRVSDLYLRLEDGSVLRGTLNGREWTGQWARPENAPGQISRRCRDRAGPGLPVAVGTSYRHGRFRFTIDPSGEGLRGYFALCDDPVRTDNTNFYFSAQLIEQKLVRRSLGVPAPVRVDKSGACWGPADQIVAMATCVAELNGTLTLELKRDLPGHPLEAVLTPVDDSGYRTAMLTNASFPANQRVRPIKIPISDTAFVTAGRRHALRIPAAACASSKWKLTLTAKGMADARDQGMVFIPQCAVNKFGVKPAGIAIRVPGAAGADRSGPCQSAANAPAQLAECTLPGDRNIERALQIRIVQNLGTPIAKVVYTPVQPDLAAYLINLRDGRLPHLRHQGLADIAVDVPRSTPSAAGSTVAVNAPDSLCKADLWSVSIVTQTERKFHDLGIVRADCGPLEIYAERSTTPARLRVR